MKRQRKKVARQLYWTGAQHFEDEDHESAKKIFEQLKAEFADVTYNPEIQMWLGACYYWLNDQKKALECLNSANIGVDRDEEDYFLIQILDYLGRVHYALGSPLESLKYFEEAEQYYHLWETSDAWRYRFDFRLLKGRVLLDLGLFKQALEELTRAEDQVPEDSWSEETDALFSYEIGRAHHYLEDNEKAQRLLNSIDVSKFTDEDLIYGYHHVMMRLGISIENYGRTLEHFEAIKLIDVPDGYWGEVFFLAGKAFYCQGQGSEALDSFKKSKQWAPLRDVITESTTYYLSIRIGKSRIRVRCPAHALRHPDCLDVDKLADTKM